MKKFKYAALLLFTAVILIVAAISVSADEPDTTIRNADDLKALATYVNTNGDTSGKTYTLANDISIDGLEWEPIGGKIINSDRTAFKGVFDGNGHTIFGLTITQPREYNALFGLVQSSNNNDAVVKNLTVGGSININNAAVTTQNLYFAGIAASVKKATIENCTNRVNITITGTVENNIYLSGIADEVMACSLINNCRNEGNITFDAKIVNDAATDSNKYLASISGIAAYTGCSDNDFKTVSILNCSNSGIISFNAKYFSAKDKSQQHSFITAGTIVGDVWSPAVIENCSNSGQLSLSGQELDVISAGGIVGCINIENYPIFSRTVKNCKNTGSVVSTIRETDSFKIGKDESKNYANIEFGIGIGAIAGIVSGQKVEFINCALGSSAYTKDFGYLDIANYTNIEIINETNDDDQMYLAYLAWLQWQNQLISPPSRSRPSPTK